MLEGLTMDKFEAEGQRHKVFVFKEQQDKKADRIRAIQEKQQRELDKSEQSLNRRRILPYIAPADISEIAGHLSPSCFVGRIIDNVFILPN
jgi:hypothetical protein